MTATADVLSYVLSAPVPDTPIPSLPDWLDHLERSPFTSPIDRAIAGGFEADRLGYAFTGGYEAALARLLGDGGARQRRSLAATESGGNHPRAIATKLTRVEGRLRLDGTKTFATLASLADEILVVATEGTDGAGRPKLRLVRVAKGTPGLTVTDRDPVPFAPEIPHARLDLDGVLIAEDAALPGDGYALYLKPFRTVEDTHVLGATLGYLLRVARSFGFDRAVVEEATALASALQRIAASDPTDPAVHVALAGTFRAARDRIERTDGEWTKAPPEIAGRWLRDRGLLLVAEQARTARTAAAFAALASPTTQLSAPAGGRLPSPETR